MNSTPEWAARVAQALRQATAMALPASTMTPEWYVRTVLAELGVDLNRGLADSGISDPRGLVNSIVRYARGQAANGTVQPLNESMLLKGWDEYRELVASAYEVAPSYDTAAVAHWQQLNQSNHLLFQRLLSRVRIIFITGESGETGKTLNVSGRSYVVEYLEGGQPYETQPEMRQDYLDTGTLRISIDYSDHPVFSVTDNIIFRCVHDFIVHIQGNHPFGAKGEIASYNLHAKLAPRGALPALFTEVIGQACYAVTYGGFPEQKIAILPGFDYQQMGKVEGHEIVDKQLTKDGVPLKAATISHDNGSETQSVGVTGAALEVNGVPESLITERADLAKAAQVRQMADNYPAYLVDGARALVAKYSDAATVAAPGSSTRLLEGLAALTQYQGVSLILAKPDANGYQGLYDQNNKTVIIYEEGLAGVLERFRNQLVALARSHSHHTRFPAARKAALKTCTELANIDWASFRNTFYHELVHQQDDQGDRLDRSVIDMTKQVERHPTKEDRFYKNGPHETNARFVARVAEMTALGEKPGYVLPAKFADFVAEFLDDDELFFEDLTAANKKAAYKRIYDLYVRLTQVPGAIQEMDSSGSGGMEGPIAMGVNPADQAKMALTEGPVSDYRDNKHFPEVLAESKRVPVTDTFTHDGVDYDLAQVKKVLVNRLVSEIPVSAVKWLLDEMGELDGDAETELDRLEHIDIARPIIVTNWEGKWVVIDGAHRLKVAVMAKLESLPSQTITEKELKQCRVDFTDHKTSVLTEGPVSDYRDNKHFPGADIQYPDVLFAGITDARQARVAIEFYQKQVALFNRLFQRKVQLSASVEGGDGPQVNFKVVTRNENGLQAEYFAYPTASMGEHTVQRFIDKYVPGTSLRHELLHEAILPFITEKFELTNHADQSAASDSIDDVQRQRAFNYSLEDVFYERVVEHLERLPDFQDTFPMSDFGKDWMARLAQEHGKKPLEISALLATQQRFLAADQTQNKFLLKVLPALLSRASLAGVTDLNQLAEPMGKLFEQWFNAQKGIFAKELQAKLADFGSRFMEIYREAQAKIAPRGGSVPDQPEREPKQEPESELTAPPSLLKVTS